MSKSKNSTTEPTTQGEKDAKYWWAVSWRAVVAFCQSQTNAELHQIHADAVALEARVRAMLRSHRHRSALRRGYTRANDTFEYDNLIRGLERLLLNLESGISDLSGQLLGDPEPTPPTA